MKSLSKILFVLGYLSVIGPPRAFNLQRIERKKAGELKNQPLIVVLFVEYLMRSVMLLLVFFSVEQMVGKFIYETYYLDYLGMLLLGIGGFHTFSYYLCFALIEQSKKALCIRPITLEMTHNCLYQVLNSKRLKNAFSMLERLAGKPMSTDYSGL
jgi:hypothetical protein